jgi:capsular polysaccharide biosynthesis protein
MTIGTVYGTLWRHKLFILLLTSALAVAAYVVTTRQQKEYTASSLVRIEQKVTRVSDLYGSLITGERLARTYALIAETSSVRELVRKQLPASIPDADLTIDAGQVSNLEVLKISVTYSDPAVAARVANAVPGALSRFARTTGASGEVISTVQSAEVPVSPSSPNVKLNVVIAIMLGLILNSGLVLLIETLSDRVGSAEELERATGHPVIAAIPPLRFVKTVPTAVPDDSEGSLRQPPPRRRTVEVAGGSPLPPERRLGSLGAPND